MQFVRISLLLLVAVMVFASPAAGDPAFVADGVTVSPTKVHFGTVQLGTCSLFDTAGCTVRTLSVTNTSETPLFFAGAGINVVGVGLGLGFDNNGTCFYLPDHLVQPGQSCSVILSAGYGGPEGPQKDYLVLFGGATTIARIPVYIRLVP